MRQPSPKAPTWREVAQEVLTGLAAAGAVYAFAVILTRYWNPFL